MRVLLLAAAAAVRVRAAGLIEDHSLSWSAAGLTDALAGGHDDALPPALFAAVSAAAPLVQAESTEGPSFKFGKHNTWWLPLRDEHGARLPPTSAIEAAIHVLYDLDFGSATTTQIVGVEWWLQERGLTDSIGYHYDKDEAYSIC